MARPSPAPPPSRAARVVELGEALEDPLTVGVGDAGTVVDDPQGDVGARLDERHDHLRTRVVRGVVEQVAHDAQELVGVAVDLRARHRAGVDGERAARVQTTGLGEDDLVEVDRRAVRGVECRRVDDGDGEQVVDESLHPDRVGEDLPLGCLPVGELRVLEVDLELRADPGERAAQLVAGVGDEAPLPIGGVLEADEHGVHRAGETADLVLAGRFGHASVQVLGADDLDLLADRLHRTERTAGHHPGDGAHEHEERRHRPPQQPHQAVGAPGHALEAARHVDHVRPGRRLDPPRHDSVRAVALPPDAGHGVRGVTVGVGIQPADADVAGDVRRRVDDHAIAVDDLHEVLVTARYGQRIAEVAVVDRGGDVLRSQPGGGLEILREGAAVRVHQPERSRPRARRRRRAPPPR